MWCGFTTFVISQSLAKYPEGSMAHAYADIRADASMRSTLDVPCGRPLLDDCQEC